MKLLPILIAGLMLLDQFRQPAINVFQAARQRPIRRGRNGSKIDQLQILTVARNNAIARNGRARVHAENNHSIV